MEIRPSRLSDLPAIQALYQSAREYMRAHGNHNQWVNGYPQPELIREDIPLEPHDCPVPWVLTERGLWEDGIPARLG